MKKRKGRMFFLIILLTFLGFKIIRGIHTYYERSNNEAYRLIDDVLKEYGTGFYPLEVNVDIYDEKKIMYTFKQKLGLDIFRKDLTWEDIQNIRKMMNAYLEEHPNYFLNDNYSIFVNIQHVTQAPWIAFTNDKSWLNIEEVDGLYDRLDCIIFDGILGTGKSLHIPVKIFKGAKAFYFNKSSYLEANFENILQIKSVEYYNVQKTDEMSE